MELFYLNVDFRPSYVLGGQGMAIAYDDTEIEEYINEINTVAQEHPILESKVQNIIYQLYQNLYLLFQGYCLLLF